MQNKPGLVVRRQLWNVGSQIAVYADKDKPGVRFVFEHAGGETPCSAEEARTLAALAKLG